MQFVGKTHAVTANMSTAVNRRKAIVYYRLKVTEGQT